MPLESTFARAWRWLRATWRLFLLEMKVVTGGRGLVLVAVELAVFATIAAIVFVKRYRGTSEWATPDFYGWTVLAPMLVAAVALSMAAIMGDRDGRQLEASFVSPGGRYRLWTFRTLAILGSCAGGATVLSILTWAILDHGFPPLVAAFHAFFPLAFVACLTLLTSVVARSGAIAGLVASAVVAVLGAFHEAAQGKWWDFFLNPLAPPEKLLDPEAWTRALVWSRVGLLSAAGLFFALTLVLLQRRERLI